MDTKEILSYIQLLREKAHSDKLIFSLVREYLVIFKRPTHLEKGSS